jgi:hypothetical protein
MKGGNKMEENKYDFEEMASNLSYVGNNDPYTADLYFRVLEQLEELAELQEQGAITITINK